MNLINLLSKSILIILLIILFSCEENEISKIKDFQTIDTVDIIGVHEFLFNIPINHDTILVDKDYNIDFRVEIEGHKIDSTFLIIDDDYLVKRDTFIISTHSIYLSEGLHDIRFLIRSVNLESGDTIFHKSNLVSLRVVKNLSNRYINETVVDGRLHLTWPELDKKYTNKYLVVRYMGGNMAYSQRIEIQDSIYTDNYYVGEEVNFKISVINNEGGMQNIWYYKKSSEKPEVTFIPSQSGGFDIHFNKSKYSNSFGQYYLTSSSNNNPELIFSSTNIEDTIYNFSDAKFAGAAQFWLRYLPKEYPQGVSDDDWMLYSNFINERFGEKFFEYESIAKINSENIAYTVNGKIYKYNTKVNQKTDSMINENAKYNLVRTTPNGNYLYVIDENLYGLPGSPAYFWSTNSSSANPDYTFHINYLSPIVSDNLIAIMEDSEKLALYDVTNGSKLYTSDFNGTSNGPKISSNGQYILIKDHALKLCSYINNTFKVIWDQSDRTSIYLFYDINQNNDECYTWDNNKKFSTRSTSDFSELNSFSLELEALINIDCQSKMIMGYVSGKVLIYDLNDGALIKEIPANLTELFFYSNHAVLIGNTIYSKNGFKYTIN